MANKNGKRKQVRLNLKQKIEMLKKLDNGVRGSRLAIEYGVTKQAISKIKKNRQTILAAAVDNFEHAQTKTLHKAEYPEVESKLYEWFLNQRARNCTVTGPVFKARAKFLFEKMYPEKGVNSFNASDGWLTKFKKRHGIRYLTVCGEILSSDTSQIAPFIRKLRGMISELGLSDAQVYNADESGLYYRLLPQKTYVAATEKTAPGRKTPKERITFMLCANADGSHKVSPTVIGKSANPRCFKGFKNPVTYSNSPSAWMTSKLFYDWFHGSFVKEVNRTCVSFTNSISIHM